MSRDSGSFRLNFDSLRLNFDSWSLNILCGVSSRLLQITQCCFLKPI